VRTALAEKEVLLKEIYHRVKNNLQVVSSLLNMQRRQVSDAGVKELLAESANRVKSMALVHEQLYRSHDLSNISFGEYLGQLAEHLASAHRPLSARVPLRLEAGEFRLGLETAVPLGLIVNELVSNAYKHGYGADAARGEIVLRAESLPDGRLRLSVTDDGRGLPEGFDPAAADSLGMQLVGTLAQQLGGELRCGSQAGRTCFQVLFRPGAREA
jgi:two-component sensor histidine kinase